MQWKLHRECQSPLDDWTMKFSWLISDSASSLLVFSCYKYRRTCRRMLLSWWLEGPTSASMMRRMESLGNISRFDMERIFPFMID